VQARAREIGICGSYGGMNLGDEAILTVIIEELSQRLPVNVTVFSRDPEDTLTRHRVHRVLALDELSREELALEVARLELLIIGGGGILFDREAAFYLRPAQVALELSIPVVTWAVGAGPLRRTEDRELVGQVLQQVDLVTVRDRSSQLLLEDSGVSREIHVTADPGFLLRPEEFTDQMLAREGIDLARPLVGISLREPGPAAPELEVERCHQLIADVVDFIICRTGATVLFLPMERSDLREAYGVAARVDQVDQIRFVTGIYSASQVRGLVGRLDLAVGMRLHFLLFAASAQVPLVGLTYGSKVAELMREIGGSMPPVWEIHPGRLIAAIDRAWDERSEHAPERTARLARLLDRARSTGQLVAELLGAPGRQQAVREETPHA
jgi:polysaccharide pyruvyl transferase CsaB